MGPPVPSSVEMCVQQISFKYAPPRYQLKLYEQTNALLYIYIPNDRLDFKTRHFIINKSAVSQIAAATRTPPLHLLICKQCPARSRPTKLCRKIAFGANVGLPNYVTEW